MNEFQSMYPQQMLPVQSGGYTPQQFGGLAPQGFFGGMLGAPLGGLIGRGIGGLLGNAHLGRQIGQAAGGIGGAFLPFGVDPVSAAYAQQAQQQALQQMQQPGQQPYQPQDLAPQGWFGNLVRNVARPLGGAIGGAFGNAGLGNTIGGIAGQLGGMLPFGADPVAQAYAQQEALLQQQGVQPNSLFGNMFVRPFSRAYSPTVNYPPGPTGMLPFGADPAVYGQQDPQQGLTPQGGWFGNLVRQVAQPLGGAFGNAGLGNTIGGIAGQLGGMLPFGADPVTQAYLQQAQQAQLAQQAQQAQLAQQAMAQQAQLAQLAQQAQPGNGALYGSQQTLH